MGRQKNHIVSTNLVLLFVAAFIVFFNFFTSLTIIPLYVKELGGTELFSGLQNTLFFLVTFVLRAYFGPLADRRGKKIPLLIGSFVFCTAPLLFLVSTNLWILTLARIYQAVGLAAFFSTGSSLVADMAPADRLGRFIAAYRQNINVTLMIGPSIALWVINLHTFRSWFKVSFLIGLVGLGAVMSIKIPDIVKNADLNAKHRLKAALINRGLWPAYLGIFTLCLSYGVLLVFASLYISTVTDASNPGIYFIYFGLASIVANLAAGYLSDRFGRRIVVWPAVLLLGAGVILFSFLSSVDNAAMIIVISGVAAGMGFSGGIAALIAWLVDLAEEHIRTTVLALQESIFDSSIAIGSIVFGMISNWFGISVSFATIGTLTCLLALSQLVPRKSPVEHVN